MNKSKAYRAMVKGFPDCVVKAINPGRVRTVVLNSLWKHWGPDYTYADVKVRREYGDDDRDMPIDVPQEARG